MPQKSITRIRGLWTNPNDVEAPEGALAVADDISLARPGIAEPRRGMLSKGAAGGSINALAEFGGQIVAHVGTNTVKRSADDGATWTAYSGTFAAPDANTPVSFTQQNGSLLMNTAAGEYELDSVTGAWRLTGAPRGLDGTATLQATSSTAGWASPDGQWAYRAVWGYRNANNYVQLGAPSGRFLMVNPATFQGSTAQVAKANGVTTVVVTGPTHGLTTGDYIDVTLGGAETWFAAGTFQVTVTNSTTFSYSDAVNNTSGGPVNPGAAVTYGMTRNVALNVPIPAGITTSNFVQIYRSGKSASDSDEPSDILGLIYETVPNALDISNAYITITDLTPDALRGSPLYTSDLGMLYAKERPPLSKCKAVWRDSTFYCATERVQSLTLRLLAVGTGNLPVGATLSFEDQSLTLQLTAGSSEAAGQFKVYSAGTTAQNIADTAKSIVRTINAAASSYSAAYLSSDVDEPGLIRVERTGLADVQFWPSGANINPRAFSPNIASSYSMAATGLVRAANVVTATTTFAHSFSVGDSVAVVTNIDPDFPTGVKTVASVPTSTSFTYAETGSDGTSTAALYAISSQYADANGGLLTTTLTRSDDEARSNRVMWSPPGEPWAVPLSHFKDMTNPVGGPTPSIKAVVPIRDKVVVWTDAGTYQVTGVYPDFQITELDVTVNIVAPRTAVAFAGQAIALTNQGLVLASESARVVSVAIDNTLKSLVANYRSNLAKYAFSVAYETEHALLLWVVDDGTDAFSSQAYPLWFGSGESYSRWTLAATAGFIRPSDGKLYIGTAGTLKQERKAYAAADHADDSAAITSVVEFSPILPVGPGAEAELEGGSFDFSEANFASATTQMATNLEPTLSTAVTISPPGGATTGARELVFPVHTAYTRGTRYRVRFTHATASERYALQGVTLNYLKVSDQAGR